MVPGRRAGRPRLREPGAVRRRLHRPTSRCCRSCCGRRAAAVAPVRRPGLAGDRAGRARGQLRELLHGAEPGSDQQLAYARRFIGVASAPDDLDLLAGAAGRRRGRSRAWPSTPSCAGSCCTGWSAGARPGRAEIDAGAGPGPHRRRRAARGRRAGPRSPTPEAKEGAWAQIIGGELPNATFRATLGGFSDTDQDELLEPYAGSTSTWWPASGGTGARTWPSTSPGTPTRGGDHPAGDRAGRRRTSSGPTRRRRCGGCSPRAATTWPGRCAAASGTPRRADPALLPAELLRTGRPRHRLHQRQPGRSSSSTARPSPSHSGIRQFGYSSLVPGMFCCRRSPTASASETPISSAGVRARKPYSATVNSVRAGRRPGRQQALRRPGRPASAADQLPRDRFVPPPGRSAGRAGPAR